MKVLKKIEIHFNITTEIGSFNSLNTGGRYTGRYVKVHIPWRPVYRPLTCGFCLHTL